MKEASQRAFESLENVVISENDDVDVDEVNKVLKKALATFSVLKGIGPATSSAFLSLYRPDLFAFMDDEVLECFIGERKYTVPAYFKLNDECRARAKELGEGWTTRRVGKGLWSAARLSLHADRSDLTLDSSSKSVEHEVIVEELDHESAIGNTTTRNGQNKKVDRKRDEEQGLDKLSNSIASRMAKRKRRV